MADYICEYCGGEMLQVENEFYSCEDCGATAYDDGAGLIFYDPEDSTLNCCIACGNPDYPKCIDSCNVI